jgi:hypothetical protein
LLTLYSQTDLTQREDPLTEEEFEDMDSHIRDLQSGFGGVPDAKIPHLMPESHWWWR